MDVVISPRAFRLPRAASTSAVIERDGSFFHTFIGAEVER